MRMIFLDEAGYTFDWTSAMEDQPFYVLGAVVLPADNLPPAYSALRQAEQQIQLPEASVPLGQGREIKAREVATGSGWWRSHNSERNGIRDLMLTWPTTHEGTAILVVVDKKAHHEKYYTPDSPYLLALQFMLERLQHYLTARNDHGYCVYDHNKRLEAEVHAKAIGLIREGSDITYYSSFYGGEVYTKMTLPNVLELALGDSQNSLGLQVADFFATFGYQYFKQGKPDPCGWWTTLRSNLDSKGGVIDGIGLKVFP